MGPLTVRKRIYISMSRKSHVSREILDEAERVLELQIYLVYIWYGTVETRV